MTISKHDYVRFWSLVDVRGEDECWEWRGNIFVKTGYGRFYVGGKGRRAHRVALSLALGRELDGLALHSCDNPPCVNPRHLREGTHKDNAEDMISRDRQARMRGESNHRSVLSEHGVEAIKKMKSDGVQQKVIAKKMGVSEATVSLVLNKRRWAHLG